MNNAAVPDVQHRNEVEPVSNGMGARRAADFGVVVQLGRGCGESRTGVVTRSSPAGDDELSMHLPMPNMCRPEYDAVERCGSSTSRPAVGSRSLVVVRGVMRASGGSKMGGPG
jgi:hypothetical protein